MYLLLVALVLDRPDEAPGLSLACAVVPFQLVMTAVVNALNAVNVRRTIILNMAFPRLLIPLVVGAHRVGGLRAQPGARRAS